MKCPAGTAWKDKNKCVSCPLGWYQPLAGQGECIKCPNFTSTRRANSRSVRACKGMLVFSINLIKNGFIIFFLNLEIKSILILPVYVVLVVFKAIDTKLLKLDLTSNMI